MMIMINLIIGVFCILVGLFSKPRDKYCLIIGFLNIFVSNSNL
jgi:hypothetical protein